MAIDLRGSIRPDPTTPIDVDVVDLSVDGFRMSIDTKMEIGAPLSLGLGGMGMVPARVAWSADGQYGCEFVTPLTPEQFASGKAGADVAFLQFGGIRIEPKAPQALGEDTWQTFESVERWPGIVRVASLAAAIAITWGSILLL